MWLRSFGRESGLTVRRKNWNVKPLRESARGRLIRRVGQTVARPLVGRMMRRFCGNVVESESSDPQGVGLQISKIHELASRATSLSELDVLSSDLDAVRGFYRVWWNR